jgi:hypothetical protein
LCIDGAAPRWQDWGAALSTSARVQSLDERDTMIRNVHSSGAQVKAWAALTLAATVTAASLVAVAGAQDSGQQRVRPDKVRKCATTAACVAGNNTGNGAGVEGEASTGFGLLGVANGQNAGVGGYNYTANPGASGIYGQSENGFGVYGYSESSSGYGVLSQGNVFVEGLVYTSGGCHAGCSRTRHQAAFSATTSQPTIDDMGEATLRGGVAHVTLSGDFANAIDATKPYLVLLTPEGDAGLYVVNRTANGFDVRQIGGGRSSVGFAYRIVAKPFGVRDERLPFKTVAAPMTLSPGHAVH